MRTLAAIGVSAFFAIAVEVGPSAAAPKAPPTAIAPSVYSAATVRDFLAACRQDNGGCVDEVANALMDKMQFDGSSHVCLTKVSYGDAVPGWLSAHPETATLATEDGIFAALKSLYPC